MSSQAFTSQVTHIPADWANDVNTLVYDVFGAAATAAAARQALGLKSLAVQDSANVNLSGGIINDVTIGVTVPNIGRFTTLRSTNLAPSAPTDVIVKAYFDSFSSGLSAFIAMEPDDVVLTGGNISGVTMQGCTINATPIGTSAPAAGVFTSVQLQQPLAVVDGGTGADAYLGKYLVYVQAPTAHFEAIDEIPIADINGWGTMAQQNAADVDITGGNLDNVVLGNDVTYSSLGSMATQNANDVDITGGRLENVTIVGITQQIAIQDIVGSTLLDHTKDLFVIDGTLASYIIDLPNPALVTKPLMLKKKGPNRIDLRCGVNVTIDGHPIHNLFQPYESVILVSDGSNYYIF